MGHRHAPLSHLQSLRGFQGSSPRLTRTALHTDPVGAPPQHPHAVTRGCCSPRGQGWLSVPINATQSSLGAPRESDRPSPPEGHPRLNAPPRGTPEPQKGCQDLAPLGLAPQPRIPRPKPHQVHPKHVPGCLGLAPGGLAEEELHLHLLQPLPQLRHLQGEVLHL